MIAFFDTKNKKKKQKKTKPYLLLLELRPLSPVEKITKNIDKHQAFVKTLHNTG